jgi:hypothetical protein
MLEPVVARQQIYFAVSIHIKGGRALGVESSALNSFTGRSRKDWSIGPRFRVLWISGDIGQKLGLGFLVPEHQLWFAGSFEIAKDLIVMLILAPIFDEPSLPGEEEE